MTGWFVLCVCWALLMTSFSAIGWWSVFTKRPVGYIEFTLPIAVLQTMTASFSIVIAVFTGMSL